MHSFQPSRGRILFEFVCALGMVASFVGAWKQTGASALLLAASVAGFYGFIRLLDLRHGKPAEAIEPKPVEASPQPQPDIHAFLKAVGPEPVVEEAMPVVEFAPVVEVVEPAVAEVDEVAQPKPRRKGGGRKSKGVEAAKVVELVQPVEAEVTEPAEVEEVVDFPLPEEAEVAEFARAGEPEFVEPAPDEDEFPDFDASEETEQPHIAPLFEPEPFARMQRRAFGRRGRL